MKILYVSDSTTVSGAEIVMLGYLEALRAAGHSAHGYVGRENPRLIEEFRKRDVPCFATGSYSREMIRTTTSPRALIEFARAFSTVAREMTDLVTDERVDVIHSISYPASLYASFAANRTRKPQVWHEHNIKRLHRANKFIYRRVAGSCRWVIGPSDAVTNNLAKSGIAAHKLKTVYNGIDLSRFQSPPSSRIAEIRQGLGLTADQKAVGLFGQMLPYKGQRTLIEAAPRILQRHPQACFFLVGALENPPYEKELREAIDRHGVADRFTFTGWRSDVQLVLRAMDVVVVGTTTPEPAALALMEGMAMERALVATRTGGTPEIVQDGKTGLLFDPGNHVQLADAVDRLLSNPELALALGTTGRQRVEERYTLNRHIRSMFELYELAAQ